MILIVAGVSGCGKSTVGALLAGTLHWRFADADGFHSEANVAKMRAGIALTDADRGPWLDTIGRWMDELTAAGQSGVVTCSALRRSYRDRLLAGRPDATVILLLVDREELHRRLVTRHNHFFPDKLLDSQLDALELPAPDERVKTVASEGDPALTVAAIIDAVWPGGAPGHRFPEPADPHNLSE